MCGIVGKLYFNPILGKIKPEEIEAMTDRLRHRGPDDAGIYINRDQTLGLGHRRLSIIDLSPQGRQPMTNEDKTIWLTFNGEIYNHRQLRRQLTNKGHRFSSQTDSETIIHLYEDFGVGCLQYLRGMFAFAIWDEKGQTLFLARDRLGKKPLKYYINNRFVVFASELKAFISQLPITPKMDPEAVFHYLSLQHTPLDSTGFTGIKKLPPAHYLTICLDGRQPKIELNKYWDLNFSQQDNYSEDEWCEMIMAKLEESVRIRMRSDVPLGAFLSGGIDSSAVVALMAKNSNQPIRTFSIGFKHKKYNELPAAKLVAKMFGTDHTEFVIRPDINEIGGIIEKLSYHYEEPFADSSALPTYILSKLTRDKVTVALSGDGGDENFAGYPWYRFHLIARRYSRLPRLFRTINKLLFFNLIKTLPSLHSQRAAAFLDLSLLPESRQYHYYLSIFYPYEKNILCRQAAAVQTDALIAAIYQRANGRSLIDKALYTDINSYLPGALLPKIDIASMAVGLEIRSPFLDHEFMELCARMPSRLKLNGGRTKHVLKKALTNILPPPIINKPKWGFRLPIHHWLKNEFHGYVSSSILNSPLAGSYFNKSFAQQLIRQHASGYTDHSRKLWSLFWLCLWHRKFLE